MTISKDFIPRDMKYSFLYGCTLELTCSLHVLSDPYHHVNCLDWYDLCVKNLKKRLMKKIVDFGEKYANWNLIMDIVDDFSRAPSSDAGFSDDFPNFIKRFCNLPREEFAYIFLGETLLGKRDVIRDLLSCPQHLSRYDLNDVYQYIEKENVDYFIRHVDEVKQDITEIMTEYYLCFFKDYWRKTWAFYKGALLKEKKEFANSVTCNFISSIHDQLSHVSGTLVMKKDLTFQIHYEQIKEIKFILSAFTYPHLMINIYNDKLTIYRNMLMPVMSSSLEDMADNIKVFSDPTRLKMVKLLMNGELSNKALSLLLSITPASVSQHLKILKDTGLVSAVKHKNNIFYRINQNQIDHILSEVTRFLQEGSGTSF